MNVEYKRDIQHNYLIIRDQIQSDSTFQEKMLTYNNLKGLLPFKIQQMNGERIINYEISGNQSLLEVCTKIPPKITQLSKLVTTLLLTLKQSAEFLLKEDDFLLSIDYMFLELPDYKLQMCYYPGYQHTIRTQLSEFFEQFMSCVDYEDRDAVYLVYSLYMKSKEVSCTINDLMKVVVDNQSTLGTKENIEQEEPLKDKPVRDKSILIPCSKIEEVHMQEQQNGINQMELQKKKNMEKKSIKMQEVEKKQVETKKTETNGSPYPLAMEVAYNPPNQRVEAKEPAHKKSTSVRPLISQSREEEHEVYYYPSKYYVFGGIIVLVVTIACGLIASSGLLRDSVTNKLEPIKLAALLVIILTPTIYGLVKLFDPKNKVSKVISIGLYEPSIRQEIAATMEYDHQQIAKRMNLENEVNILNDIKETRELDRSGEFRKDKESIESIELGASSRMDLSEDIQEFCTRENTRMVKSSEEEQEGNRTVLLNGNKVSPFPQLLSEKPEAANSITIMECPFYIGTVKNRMNYSLTSPVISRYHAKIEMMGEAYYLTDLSSTNGTFLNGRRIVAEEPNLLVPGDKIAFANICFIFTCPNR